MGARGFLKTIGLLSVVALLAASCGGEDGAGDGEAFDLRIGAVLPLTGALSFFGPAMERGTELAVEVFEEAADAAGQNIDVTLIVEDSQTDPDAGVEAARKLVDTDGVHVIVGAAASGVTIPVAEAVTIPNRITQCSPSATSGDITQLEDDGFVNRVPPSDEHQAPILADLVAESLSEGAKVNLGARNDDYGNYLINEVARELGERGLEVGSPTLWDPEGTTFDSEAGQIVSGDPDGWVLVDFPGTWQQVSAALVRTGNWDPARTFTADGMKAAELPADSGRQATEGMRGTAPGGGETFDDLWNERVTDQGRGPYDAQSFDCTMLLMLGAVAAGGNDSEAIRDEIRGVSGPGGTKYSFRDIEAAISTLADGQDIDFDGASGPLDLDENGDPVADGAVYEIFAYENEELVITRSESVEAPAG